MTAPASSSNGSGRPDRGGEALADQAPVVLVVDDEHMIRRMLSRVLSRSLPVTAAADGPSALAMADDLNVAVAVLDIQMPGMSGLELAALLLDRPDPPVIILLSALFSDVLGAADVEVPEGVLACLGKPPDMDHLVDLVVRAYADSGRHYPPPSPG